LIFPILRPRALPWAEGGRPVGPQESCRRGPLHACRHSRHACTVPSGCSSRVELVRVRLLELEVLVGAQRSFRANGLSSLSPAQRAGSAQRTADREPQRGAIILYAALQTALIFPILKPRALPWAEGGRPVGPQESAPDSPHEDPRPASSPAGRRSLSPGGGPPSGGMAAALGSAATIPSQLSKNDVFAG